MDMFLFVWTACLCIKHYNMTVKQSCIIASVHGSLREVIWKLLTPVFGGVTVVNRSTAISLWKQDFRRRIVQAPMSWKVPVSQTSERNSSQILSFTELIKQFSDCWWHVSPTQGIKIWRPGTFLQNCLPPTPNHFVLIFSEHAHYI